jgi:hypothetical protein
MARGSRAAESAATMGFCDALQPAGPLTGDKAERLAVPALGGQRGQNPFLLPPGSTSRKVLGLSRFEQIIWGDREEILSAAATSAIILRPTVPAKACLHYVIVSFRIGFP